MSNIPNQRLNRLQRLRLISMEADSTCRLTRRRTLSFCFLQFSDYLSSFFLGREFDSAGRALFFTACTEHYTIIRILHDRSLFSLVLFKLVRAELTVVYAFSAADAFFIVYCWTPRYLSSRDSVACFFRQFFHRLLLMIIFC